MKFILLALLSFKAFSVYITDEVDIPIRSERSFGDNIVRSLQSGTKLDVLASVDGWSKVQFENTTGWIISRYLTNSIPAKETLAKLLITNSANKQLLNKQSHNIEDLQDQLSVVKESNKRNSIEKLKALANVRHIKKTYQESLAIEYHNNKLIKENLNLKTEIKILKIGNKASIENSNQKWFAYGGSLLLIGVIVGIIATKNNKRRLR